jgi:DNA polymerase beta
MVAGDAAAGAPIRRYRRLDLRLVPFDSYHAATLYFTGSDQHNKLMRNRAIELGFKLSEYGLFKMVDGAPLEKPEAVQSERDIFDLLGMPYKTPQERDI